MRRLKSKSLAPVILICLLTIPVLARERRRLDLSIIGTKVERDKTGLPARLEGMVFFRGGPRDGGIAGMYEETLLPRMDPELGLVGTIGRSVFHFVKRDGSTVSRDRIVTLNQSTIVGEIPRDGALLVESTGRVIHGGLDGGSGGVGGTLGSNATVRLGANFELDVNVTLTFGNPEKRERSPSPERGAPAEDASLVVTVGADGETRVHYSREFKRGLVGRLTGADAVSAAALSVETGLSEALLSRWGQQAEALALLRKLPGAFRPAPRGRTFEEKLGIVLETATYSEDELEEFVARAGLSTEEIAQWCHALDTALEADAEDPLDGARARGAQEAGGGAPRQQGVGLNKLAQG